MSESNKGKSSFPRVAIIGGGLGGTAAAVYLRRAKITNFTIFEKSEGPGGVWWDNTYPGAEVDTASHMYSYSFSSYAWSATHASRRELQQYVEDTIDQFGLRDHYRFAAEVVSTLWDDSRSQYSVTLADGKQEWFDFVISAVGLLSVPMIPAQLDLASFAGRIFHTSRWDHEYDFAGKRVAVVGTGSTAIQVVPALADMCGQLYVFQREPGWIMPKKVTVYSETEKIRAQRPLTYKIQRIKTYMWRHRARGPKSFREGTKQNLQARDQARAFIERELGDRPDLMQLVTPTYPYGGKRPVSGKPEYYQAFKRDNVKLVPEAVASAHDNVIVTTAGSEFEVDAIVLATGFRTTDFLSSFTLRGTDQVVQDFWAGEPAAYLGITIPTFPNFFMLYGPNTNGMGLMFMLERQADYAVRSIKASMRHGNRPIDVSRRAYDRYNEWLEKRLKNTVWATVNNYFKTASGRIVTQFPEGLPTYWLFTKTLRGVSSRFLKRNDPADSASNIVGETHSASM